MKKQGNKINRGRGDHIAGKLAAAIHAVQKRWSEAMGQFFAKLSLKGRWTVLAGFILLMIGLNGYLIAEAISGKKDYLDSKVKISIPVMPDGPKQVKDNILPDEITSRIKSFKAQMDSLSETPEGRRKRDSILNTRKGLVDSIAVIDELYQQLNNQ